MIGLRVFVLIGALGCGGRVIKAPHRAGHPETVALVGAAIEVPTDWWLTSSPIARPRDLFHYRGAMRITVNYPVESGRLVLRTAHDWDRDVEAVEVHPTVAVFEVACDGPTLAIKPCLRSGDVVLWAKGADYIVSAYETDRGLWPYFHGEPRGHVSDVLHVEFEGETRAVRVYRPPGYAENVLHRFPVLYMQDGQNLFFPQEAFQGTDWRVDETMDRLDAMNALRKAIVVGIAPVDRERDYTSPGYVNYGRFLVEKLKPLIDAQHRTYTGPEDTVVMGSSLGGVVALYLGWHYPGTFGRVACLSSTFGYRDDLFKRIEAEPKQPLLIYLDSGWPKDNYDVTNAMRDLLMSRGYTLGVDLLQFSFPDAAHNESSWAGRIHVPFQYFFGRSWLAQREHG